MVRWSLVTVVSEDCRGWLLFSGRPHGPLGLGGEAVQSPWAGSSVLAVLRKC